MGLVPLPPTFATVATEFVGPDGGRLLALSIRQPWAWLIANGHKDVENRTWPTSRRIWFLIHAAVKMTKWDYELAAMLAGKRGVTVPPRDELECGGIVGKARIVGCEFWHPQASRWHEKDCFGFYLADAKPLPFTPCLGRLSFFLPKL